MRVAHGFRDRQHGLHARQGFADNAGEKSGRGLVRFTRPHADCRQPYADGIEESAPRIIGEQIEALKRIAGAKVAARIRPQPDELVMGIVSGWAERIDAKRAGALGFKAETSFDDIVRAHIEDELGGKIAN